MLFKCKNCGGNAIYSPVKKAMYCPHCEGIDTEQKVQASVMTECVNCGAPLEIGDFTSACKCEHCGSYLIMEEKVEGELTPHLILPFQISKQQAVESLKSEFSKRMFTPASFLSEASIASMEGTYVPFFMYDYQADASYRATGTKVKVWRSGDTEYTETSFYNVERAMDVTYDKIPVDASKAMDDGIMDLMEPYDYQALENFQEKYMSGFYGETYSESAEELGPRAMGKAKENTHQLLADTISGYTTLTSVDENIDLTPLGQHFALLPVWVYNFRYRGKEYKFHVNGQTGKVIGVTPVSKPKVLGFSAAVFAVCALCGILIGGIATGNLFGNSYTPVDRGNTQCTTERVFDYADKLTDTEEDDLRELIAEKEYETGSDIVVVTLDESLVEYAAQYEDEIGAVSTDKCVMVYADNFYEENGFGYDKPVGDGTLLLDNWYREADGSVYSWMCTSGKAQDRFSQSMIDSLLTNSLENVDSDPYGAYAQFVRSYAKTMATDGDETMPFSTLVFVILIVSLVIALIFLLANWSGKKGKKTVSETAYVVGGKPTLKHRSDTFLRKSVTKRRIETSSSSGKGGGGSHRSAGGSSFGGGGHRR